MIGLGVSSYLEFVYKLSPQPQSSFRWKLESSVFRTFWMPDQVRHDGLIDFMDRLYLTVAKKRSKREMRVLENLYSGTFSRLATLFPSISQKSTSGDIVCYP